jgi:uncharacterized peroxidase-related enzyme
MSSRDAVPKGPVLMPFFPSMPADALVKDVYSLNPGSFRHWCHVEEAIMRGPSAFTSGERELMAAYVSQLNSCSYCYSSHSEAAMLLGVERSVFEATLADIDTAPIDKRFKPIFKFLRKLTQTPYKMVQADADAIYAEGWDEKALHDIVMVCCCFSFMNRLADGHGLPSDPTLFKARAKRHAEEGYLGQYLKETEA